MKRLGATALLLAGCAQAPAVPVPPADVVITVREIAYDADSIEIERGRETTVALVNLDEGLTHNMSIYAERGASTPLFDGEVVTGPASIVYRVPALEAGTYFFRCEPHPGRMTGELVVS